jgi:hypothetical protein
MNDLIFYRIIIIIMARFEVVGTAENERSLQVVPLQAFAQLTIQKNLHTHSTRDAKRDKKTE